MGEDEEMKSNEAFVSSYIAEVRDNSTFDFHWSHDPQGTMEDDRVHHGWWRKGAGIDVG